MNRMAMLQTILSFFIVVFLSSTSILIAQTPAGVVAKVAKEVLKHELVDAGTEALKEHLFAMRKETANAGRAVGLDGAFAVSTDVIDFSQIDEHVRQTILGRRKAIKAIIWETAQRIEHDRDTSIEFKRNKLSLSSQKKEMFEQLDSAIASSNVALSSLAIAIKMVVNISTELREAAISEQNPDRKFSLYVEYTALVYELSNIVVEILDNFEHKGISDIQQLYATRKQNISEKKERIESLREALESMVQNQQFSRAEANAKIKSYNDLIASLDVALGAWNKVFDVIDEQKEWAIKIRSKTGRFKFLRNEASIQLEILEEIGIVKTVLESLRGIEDITDIAELPLLTLDAETTMMLIGVDEESTGNLQRTRESTSP